MTVTFYKNDSPVNQLNKVCTQTFTANGQLKNESSILAPSLLVKATTAQITGSNYFKIDEFGRYYFITDPPTFYQGLWQVGGSVDVLMSWREQILSQNVIISRSSNQYNLYYKDTMSAIQQNMLPQYLTTSRQNVFDNYTFVLMVTGSYGQGS